MQSSEIGPRRPANRLAGESSPYLRQHQYNPVDWRPWGAEAFADARAQDKPIFLSVGYSACYWCHVMERESFENEAVAREMNARFINIKVDREQRPDVDALYMTAVQALTRQGGWPMSVFLTPGLRPFYGGTYFPPTDAHGRPGFVSLLRGVDDAWKNRRSEVEQSAEQIMGFLQRLATPPPPREPIAVDRGFVDALVRRSIADHEPRFGGFGHAPKFPRETLLELLLHWLESSETTQAAPTDPLRDAVTNSLRAALDAMAAGGIRDQLGGGFHRYSTDSRWLVPHFEIMLYDNAMLGWVYAEASAFFNDARYSEVARGVFDFLLRELTSPEGLFYTALDAEVDAREGQPYLWTQKEVEALLPRPEAERFCKAYGLALGPNFADPHHGSGEPDSNVLFIAEPGPAQAPTILDPALRESRATLYQARRRRKQPMLDDKTLTSWNALAIRALAHGGRVLGEPRYIAAAARAARELLDRRRSPDGSLSRAPGAKRETGNQRLEAAATYRAPGAERETGNQRLEAAAISRGPGAEGETPIPGFLDDYAFFAQALLELARADSAGPWRDAAMEIVAAMRGKFTDAETGAFYFTAAGADELIVRQMTAGDSPLPSGNAVAAMVLLELGDPGAARQVVATFAAQLDAQAEGMSSMVQAALLYLAQSDPFTVAEARETPEPAKEAAKPESPAAPEAGEPLDLMQIAQGVVALKAHWASPTELHVRVSILKGFHINAHAQQNPGVPLIATTLTVDAPHGPTPEVQSIDYPPGELQAFGFLESPIRVYAGDVVIAVRFRAIEAAAGPLRLSLRYQPCDENACLPPVARTIAVQAK